MNTIQHGHRPVFRDPSKDIPASPNHFTAASSEPPVSLARRLGLILLIGQLGVSLAQANTQVYAWGDNSAGQSSIPAGLTNAQVVAGGYRHSLALSGNGRVTAWGFDNFGQTNVPGILTNVAATAGGEYYSLALQSNGTVVSWGNPPAAPAGLTNLTAIAAGWLHCLALRTNGTVIAWGANTAGQTNVPAGLTNVVAIAAGSNTSLALQANGLVVAWGDNTYGQTNVPAQLTNVAAIAAGASHFLALNRDGSVVAWGANFDGQATVPSAATNVVAIAAGALHSVVLQSDGALMAWGDNTYGQTNVSSPLTGFFSIAAGAYHDLAVQGNGAPFVFVPPQTQTVFLTDTATLTVLATGAQPLGYQWKLNTTNIVGATNSVLVIANAQATNAGSYTVLLSNYVAQVTSPAALLSVVGQPPSATVQPQTQTVNCGSSPSFQATAVGTPPLSYQWLFQGTPISGATNSSLVLNDVLTNQSGAYALALTNLYGSTTSAVVTLTVTVLPPPISSPLTATATQGVSFSYQITALDTPIAFGASGLPQGLTVDPVTGIISGIPTESGTFGPSISAVNACAVGSATLVLYINSSVPVITSRLAVNGREETPFTYQIAASQSPTSFGAANLPVGLSVNPTTGVISGIPTFSGVYYSTISASNVWGIGVATLQMTFADESISGLSITNLTYSYASPYLLNFQFSLLDNNNPNVGNAVDVDPSLLTVTCFEDSNEVIAADTGIILRPGNELTLKAFLVIDFADTIASLANGETNGISDAEQLEISGSEAFVSQQPPASQIGIFEFNRDDVAPTNIVSLTNNPPTLLENAIAGILTNYVQGFSSGSQTWDAVADAIKALGLPNTNEQHYVILVSDGIDESSMNTLDQVIGEATNANVEVYCLGFGYELPSGSNNLIQLASQTGGRYFGANNLSDMVQDFDLISKDLNGQYILRWATLKRNSFPFMPSFTINYQGFTATSTPVTFDVTTNIASINTNVTPAITNYVTITNGAYVPSSYAGIVTTGLLSLASVPNSQPTALTLNAYYVPRDISEIHLHYRANWPCTVSLFPTNQGGILTGWSLTQTNDTTNGFWLTLNCPPPADASNSIPFASFGNLLSFDFQDVLFTTSNALSFLTVDNTIYTNAAIYTNAGGQVLVITNLVSAVTNYPALPHGTPVPWLLYYGISGNLTNAELLDPDHDGMPTWQEYLANTIPTNAASKLAISSVTRAPDGIRYQVTFGTSQDRTYSLLSSTDLISWQTVQANIPGVGTPATNVNVTIIDTTYYFGAQQVFYRVSAY